MLVFSLNASGKTDAYSKRVWDAIHQNKGYIKKFNGADWEEATHKIYLTAIEHRDDNYADLGPYIKKLARTILKVKKVERPYNVYTEDGEIAPLFYGLKDYINTDNLEGVNVIKDVFKEMYLLDTESFMKLKALYSYDDASDLKGAKDLKIKNTQLSTEFSRLIYKYGSETVFRTLYEFFCDLPKMVANRETNLTKEIVLKEANFTLVEKLSDAPLIKDIKGQYHYIDKSTLTMTVNPDYIKWDIVGSSICDVLKIDIAPLMNYIYEEVCVDQGVNTRHIQWCDNKYKVTTPGGSIVLGLDIEKFISMVRVELILNLIANNVNTIVAVSPDNVYIKPTKSFQFDRIRLKLCTGKIIDLPITVHIKKRK